jgi:hypothetical protein
MTVLLPPRMEGTLREVSIAGAAVLDRRAAWGQALTQRVVPAEGVIDVDVGALQVAHTVRAGSEFVAAVENPAHPSLAQLISCRAR